MAFWRPLNSFWQSWYVLYISIRSCPCTLSFSIIQSKSTHTRNPISRKRLCLIKSFAHRSIIHKITHIWTCKSCYPAIIRYIRRWVALMIVHSCYNIVSLIPSLTSWGMGHIHTIINWENLQASVGNLSIKKRADVSILTNISQAITHLIFQNKRSADIRLTLVSRVTISIVRARPACVHSDACSTALTRQALIVSFALRSRQQSLRNILPVHALANDLKSRVIILRHSRMHLP